MNIIAKITLIKPDTLLFQCLSKEIIENVVYPTEQSRIGTVVINSKNHVSITKEALPLLEDLFDSAKSDGGDLGDIDWFYSNKGCCFSWLGLIERTFKIGEEVWKPGKCDYQKAIKNKEFTLLD